MHKKALKNAYDFANKYLGNPDDAEKLILDVGSLNINGSLLQIFRKGKWKYTGVDIQAGKCVDIVLTDPYKYPFEDQHFDVTVSSSCFEHCEFFWMAFTEMVRVTKTGGFIYLSAPYKDGEHRMPVDCWRFLNDGFKALAKWCPDAKYLEGFMDGRPNRDCVGIYKVERQPNV